MRELNVRYFDLNFKEHPILKLINTNSEVIGTYKASNTGILIPINAQPDYTLTYTSSKPITHKSFPVNKLYTSSENVQGLERKLFPLPDDEILSSISGFQSKLLSSLFLLRFSPLEISNKLQKKFLNFEKSYGLKIGLNRFINEIKSSNTGKYKVKFGKIVVIEPQTFDFTGRYGDGKFTITPGNQIINQDQRNFLNNRAISFKSNKRKKFIIDEEKIKNEIDALNDSGNIDLDMMKSLKLEMPTVNSKINIIKKAKKLYDEQVKIFDNLIKNESDIIMYLDDNYRDSSL